MITSLKNAKEEKFCRLYAYGNSGTESYHMAYGRGKDHSRAASCVKAAKLLKREDINRRIDEIRNRVAIKAQYTQEKLFSDALAIATIDKREFMEVRHGACRYCYGVKHQYQWREREYNDAMEDYAMNGGRKPDKAGGFGYKALIEPNPDCPDCEGAGIVTERLADSRTYSPAAILAFDGFKPTAHGLELKTVDRAPYLNIISKMLGVAEKRVLSGPDGGAVKIDVSGLSAEALEELARLAPDD